MRGRPPLPGGPYLVVGLARSGAATARALTAHGEVMGCDAGHPPEAERLEGVEVVLGAEGTGLLDRARVVVKSPGVPGEAPVVRAARERGLPVLGELEVAWRMIPNEFVAVTGTNGKTTTVELLGAVHRAAGIPVRAAGNVGVALASLVGALEPGAVVVCEASSFQLEDAEAFAPEGAVLLNVTPDHLDRHGSFEGYRAATYRVFARQRPGDVAVSPRSLPPPGPARWISFGPRRAPGRPGAGPATGERSPDAELLLDPESGELGFGGAPLMDAREIRLRGAHNLENAMAAAAAALGRGIDPAAVREALAGFAGVPHRLEEVARSGDGVLFVNDSKATNVDSARVGIEAFDGGVHAILGGSLKGGGFAELRPAVASRCRRAYLIGQAAERLAEDLDGAVALSRCGDLDGAVAAAARAAAPGEVVLLSPACASFDSFLDFEDRGERFRALAQRIAATHPGPA